jgi:FKBP-type peptidyl-prolyl cis-trans isomerase SlyD
MTVEKNKVVTISYRLSTAEGELLDSSEENGDLPYIHGTDFLAPGIEEVLAGKSVGDKVDAKVPAAKAFGEFDEELLIAVDKDDINIEDEILEEGLEFEAEIRGELRYCRIEEIEGSEIRINANHPLAGLDIHFEAEVLGIRDATAEELDHGHVHDEHGHHHDH